MGVTMSHEEAWEFIASGHTGILITLRLDGSPVAVPVWFTVLGEAVYLTTLEASAKVRHIRRDPRVSFLIEAGKAWAELRAVLISGTATIVQDPATVVRVVAQVAEKYASFSIPDEAPAATRRYYSAKTACLRIDPDRPLLSWDNCKLMRPRSAQTSA
jgi:PPOX class probable F420-dependent enzyme